MVSAPLGAAGRSVRALRPACVALLAAALATAGCKVTDDERPLPPTLDRLPARTARTSIVLSGAAEPGARIVLTRLPALPQALPPVEADAATARFSLEVPLEPERANVFSAVAVDLSGRASAASTVSIVQGRALPTSLALHLADARPQLGLDGKGALRARASLRLSEEGLPLAGYRVRFTVADYPDTIAPQLAVTDQNGVATATLLGLGSAASGSVQAVALDAPEGAQPGDSARFEVQPGLPTSLALELSAPAVQPGTQLTVPAGTDVAAKATIKDAAGNLVAAPVSLSVIPDAFVAGGVLRFVKAGSYQVTASVARPGDLGPLTATGTVVVQPNTGGSQNTLQLFAALPGDLVAGEPVQVQLALVDPAGNQVSPASVSAILDVGMAFDAAARKLTCQKAGTFALTFKADRGDGLIVSAPPVRVRVWPAAARTLELTLGGSAAPLSSPKAVTPGQELLVGASAKDAFGNLVPAPALVLGADPEVELIGRTLVAPRQTGLYTVSGQIDGTLARALVALSVQPTQPASLTATCPTVVDAGAPFTCSALVQDAAGNTLSQTTPSTTVAWSVIPADGSEVQGGRLTLRTAGVVQIAAQLPGGGPRTERSVTVRPGPAATVRLTVNPGSVAVGQTAQLTTSVVDAFLNPVLVPVDVTTDAPGALAAGGVLSNLRQPGTFQVFARAGSLSAQAPLAVTAAAAQSVRLSVSPATTAAGVPVQVQASVVDAQGNPAQGTAELTVDGARPDGAQVQLSQDGQLTLLAPGTHRVTATLGSVSDTRLVDVRALPDTTAPELTLLVEGGVRQGSALLFKPGQTVQVSVRARDAGGLTGVRIRASGTDLGLLTDSVRPFAQPRTESEEVLSFTLPAERVGSFTLAATASDLAGNAATTEPVALQSDFHFDRIQFGPGAASGAVARTVSLDPALLAPAGLAFGPGGTLHALNLASLGATGPGAGGAVQPVGRGGLLETGWSLGSVLGAVGLASLTGTSDVFLFAGGRTQPENANVVMRLTPGVAAPQNYTSPPLSIADNFVLSGLALETRTTQKGLYASEVNTAPPSSTRGRITAMAAKDQLSGFAVNPAATSPREVAIASFADFRPTSVCTPDGTSVTELYFTGERSGTGGALFSGLYRVAFVNGLLPHGAASATAVLEEPRTASAGTVVYGPCFTVAGSTPRILFTRWIEGTEGPGGGKLQSVPASCGGSCTAQDVAQGSSGQELGRLWGLLRQGGAVYLSETSAHRLLRMDGVF